AVVFTLEEIIGNMNTKSMGPILIASLIASITASMLIGQNSVFTPLEYSYSDGKELFFYVAVGIVAGFAGPLFVNNTIFVKALTQKFFKHPRLSPILMAFCLVGVLAFIDPRVTGNGLNLVNALLLGKVPP